MILGVLLAFILQMERTSDLIRVGPRHFFNFHPAPSTSTHLPPPHALKEILDFAIGHGHDDRKQRNAFQSMNRRRFLGALPFLYTLPKMGWAGGAASQPSNRYFYLVRCNGRWSLQAPSFLRPAANPFFGRPDGDILKTGKEFSFVDVWDSAFQTKIAACVSEDGRRFRNNPNLIGWIWTDSLPWDLATSRLSLETDWVSFIRQLPAQAPGKRQYVDFLLRRYQGNFRTVNRLYGSNCGSRDGLLNFPFIKVDWQNRVIFGDDDRFLQRIAGEYYRQLAKMYRRHDPNRLIFGDIYGYRHHPQTVLSQAVKFVDALCLKTSPMKPPFPEEWPTYTRHGRSPAIPALEHLHRLYGKPILLFGHPDQRVWAMRKPYLIGFSSRPSPADYPRQTTGQKHLVEVKSGNGILLARLASTS